MAACQDDYSSSLVFGRDEIVLAIRLAEALRSDEVEIFLEIYDSIPSSTQIKRVSIGLQSVSRKRCILLPCERLE